MLIECKSRKPYFFISTKSSNYINRDTVKAVHVYNYLESKKSNELSTSEFVLKD